MKITLLTSGLKWIHNALQAHAIIIVMSFQEIPPRFSLDNYDVFASYRIEGVRSRVGEGGESDVCKEPLISCPQNIPKHVMNSIHSSSNKPDMTSGVVMGITSTVAEITDDEMSSSGGKSASTLEVNYQGTDGELGETGNFETVRRKRGEWIYVTCLMFFRKLFPLLMLSFCKLRN